MNFWQQQRHEVEVEEEEEEDILSAVTITVYIGHPNASHETDASVEVRGHTSRG